MSLKRKIQKRNRLKAELAQLEREILEEGFTRLQTAGEKLLMKPRIERVMAVFG